MNQNNQPRTHLDILYDIQSVWNQYQFTMRGDDRLDRNYEDDCAECGYYLTSPEKEDKPHKCKITDLKLELDTWISIEEKLQDEWECLRIQLLTR